MTNPIINPQPNYSGVTIQISNPAVYTGGSQRENQVQVPYNNQNGVNLAENQQIQPSPYATYPNAQSVAQNPQTQVPTAYPPQYYLNNYNYQNNTPNDGVQANKDNDLHKEELNKLNQRLSEVEKTNLLSNPTNIQQESELNGADSQGVNNTRMNSYQQPQAEERPVDMSKSNGIIDDLDERNAKMQEEKKNTKQKRVVALTDEYIKSLENYLNNPNDEIRLMASKEILTRLDEDKDRYTDAALNALLNKMLQDPSKLIRISALSAFASQLASGNDYTVTLLQNIQQNPNADKEDVLQAADILLKMSAGTEVRNIPNPKVKETKEGK